MPKVTSPVPVVIANGASLSAMLDCSGGKLQGIIMPSAWTAAGLSFAVSNKSDGTFVPLYDNAGSEVTVTAAINQALNLAAAPKSLDAWRFIKIRSGTAGTPVSQAAERTLIAILVQE